MIAWRGHKLIIMYFYFHLRLLCFIREVILNPRLLSVVFWLSSELSCGVVHTEYSAAMTTAAILIFLPSVFLLRFARIPTSFSLETKRR